MSKNKSAKPKKSKKKTLIIVLSIILALVIAFLIWFFMPRKIIDVDINKVDSIYLSNGNTGRTFEITDKEEIEYIYNKVKDVRCRVEWLNAPGHDYIISFRDTDGKSLDRFIHKYTDHISRNGDFDIFLYKITKGNEDLSELVRYLDSRYDERITE